MRDYDPPVGRYIESDPVGLDGGIDTDNPVALIDPRGQYELKGVCLRRVQR
jgi:RHS repeat-associated protein